MVAPIIGPINQTINLPKFYQFRNRYKQAFPIDRPLRYDSRQLTVLAQSEGRFASQEINANWKSHQTTNESRIRAYDDLKSKLGSTAQLGVALSEVDKSLATIYSLSNKLFQISRSIKRGLTHDMMSDRALVKLKARDFSGTWLEVSYGVIPTYQDIYSSVDVIQNPVPPLRIKGTGSSFTRERYSLGPNSYTRYLLRRDTTCVSTYGTEVAVSNPNLYLANQLGLVNPLSFLLERTPWSFVLNWFINLDQFMSQGTDFYGLALRNQYTSTRQIQTKYYQWSTSGKNGSYLQDSFDRTLGLATPSLGLRQARAWGWQRAANAVSLLANNLRSF